MSIRAIFVSLALTLCFTAAVPAGVAAGQPPKDELVIGVAQFPTTLHPSIDSMIVKAYVLGFVHRPITAYNAKGALECLLCTKLPTLENGLAKLDGKGMTVTFALRPEAKWADGVPVSTDDVLFSWQVGRHGQSGVANADVYHRIVKIEAGKDKKTFTIHLAQPSTAYNVLTDFRLLPAHLETKAFAEPAEYRNRTTYTAQPTNAGLYDGPYRVAEMVYGRHLVLERNPHWGGKPPAFRRIVIRAIENTVALEAALRSHEIDMIAGENGLPLDQAVSLDNRKPTDVTILFKPGLVYEHLDVNPQHPALRDIRVRKAILYGFDRQAISREMFGNRLPVALTNVSPEDPAFAPGVAVYPYSPQKAGQLLDEAGWKTAARGIRRSADGEPLVIDLVTTAGNHSRELMSQVIQMELRKIGIEVRLRTEAPRSFFGTTVTRRQFSGLALYSWYGTPDQVPRSTLHSAHIPTAENNYSGQNFTGYADPRMDKVIEALESELDKTKRKALWGDLQALYASELPALPLFFNTSSFIIPSWLTGLEPTGHDAPTSLWVENWGG